MSRCFPYPPGFGKNEALIQQQEPIKLQEEAEKAKKEKREKKREKKEQKKRKRESELLDRRTISTVTEEHRIGSQNSCDSTLNSNNSNKRPEQNLSPECRQNSGNIFRIRLPLQRHKDQDVLPSEELPSQLPPHSNNAPMEQPPARLPLRDPVSLELSIKETQPSRLPIQSNKVEKPFRLPLQRTNAPEEKQPSQLSFQTNKECRLPVQKSKVLPKDEQPSRLPLKTRTESTLPPQDKHTSLKRKLEQEALVKEKKTCLVSLQEAKNPDVLHRERQQPSQLPPQTDREQKVVPNEKKPSQLPIRTNKDQKVVAKEKQFSELPLPAKKDWKVEDKGKQPCQLPLQRNSESAVLSKHEKPSQLLSQMPVVQPFTEKQPCAVSRRTADANVQERSRPAENREKPSKSKGESKEEKKSRRKASAYKELFEKWTEPPHFMSLLPMDVDDDDGWLCKTNSSRNCGVQNPVAAVDSMSCCGYSVSWPRARLLPAVDIYTLPYTVPF